MFNVFASQLTYHKPRGISLFVRINNGSAQYMPTV
jgi:hypothetical protein